MMMNMSKIQYICTIIIRLVVEDFFLQVFVACGVRVSDGTRLHSTLRSNSRVADRLRNRRRCLLSGRLRALSVFVRARLSR